MKIAAAILARAKSPETPRDILPQRPLAMINGRPVLELVVERLQQAATVDRVVVAVGRPDQDADIIAHAERLGVRVYSGHPDDILDRLDMVAREEQADHLVRVNGNFPLLDPGSLDDLVARHLEIAADFSLNSHYHGIVYGLGVEVVSAGALRDYREKSISRDMNGLGTLYFHHNQDKYKVYFHPARKTAPHLRVGVDYEPDIRLVSEILAHVPRPDNESVIDFLESRPDLVAAQEIVSPAEVSLEKVLLFPDKVQALRLNSSAAYDPTYPISVELSLTNRCNHDCVWCSDKDLRSRLGGEMGREVLTDLFHDLKAGGTRGIVIEGGGEPTLHPDFRNIVRDARRAGLALGLITNGYLLPDPETLAEFEWIRISLDAASRDQYLTLKGVDGFDRVINNLLTISACGPGPILGVGYVVSNRNDDPVKLEQLVIFLRKRGIHYVHFRPVVDHPELTSSANLDFLKKYEIEHFSVNTAAMIENSESGNNGLPCLAHSLSSVITADGSVFLCGRLNSSESWPALGNLHSRPFHEIWIGDERRRQVGLASSPEFCRANCPQCRMTKYNRILTDLERIKTRNFI